MSSIAFFLFMAPITILLWAVVIAFIYLMVKAYNGDFDD